MRKFLRFLMLVLMAAYGMQSYGEVVTFKAGQNRDKDTPFYPKKPGGKKNKGIDQSEVTFEYNTKGKLNTDHNFIPYNAYFWQIYKNNNLTITSTRKMRHISMSFAVVDTETTGAKRIKVIKEDDKEVATDDETQKLVWHKYDYSYDSDYGDGAWTPSNGSGNYSVTFRAVDNECDILWIKIFYDDSSSNKSLIISTGKDFDSQTTATLTQTGYNGAYWTSDNTDPETSSTRQEVSFSSSSATITVPDYSCYIRAIGYYTDNAHSKDGEVDEADKDAFKMFGSEATKQHFRKYYDLKTNQYNDYATFCYSGYSWYVPYGVTAWTFNNTSAKKAPCVLSVTQTFNGKNKDVTQNDIIGAGMPVVLKGAANSTYRFINPDQNAAGKTGASILIGNGSGKTLASTSFDSSYYYYYLMREYNGGPWGFFWYNSSGSAAELGPHKAYLRFKKSDAKAKSFIIQMPDDDSTTGIVAIPVGDPATPTGLDASVPMYNAAGQRVGASYRGIVIQNGRKFIKR